MQSAEGSAVDVWREVVQGFLVLAAVLFLVWVGVFFLTACAPIINVQPCECPQRAEHLPWGDWQIYLPTYPPQEVPGVPGDSIPWGEVQDNYAERVILLDNRGAR